MTVKPSPIGRVQVDGQRATLTFERRFPYPPDAVWKAITEPNELSKWYMEAKLDGRQGGSIEFSSEAGHVTGSILVWDPPRIFEHEWKVDRLGFPKGEYGVIRWELVPDGGETLLRLIHRNLAKETAHNFAPGIHAILDRLEAYLNKSPLPDWMKRSEELRSSYSP